MRKRYKFHCFVVFKMFVKYRISKTLLWVINLLLIILVMFTIYRIVTFFAFRHKFYPNGIGFDEVIPAFLLGIRYDLRWISIVLMPIVLFSMWPRLSPFYSSRNKKFWSLYLAVLTLILFFFFAIGFGSLEYNQTPLDAAAINFFQDFNISFEMIRQTYPVFWMLLGLVAVVIFFRWMYHRSHWQVINKTDGKGIPHRKKHFAIAAFILFLFIWGNLWWPPLSRGDSFRFRSEFKSYLSLNPLQSFFGTIKLRRPDVSKQKAKDAYPLVAEWMAWPDKKEFNYRRVITPRSGSLESRPNIILVQCESFSMYKSSMSGNPLDASPFFKSLCDSGIFFERCFTPHFATARGLFAILTGIPDAQQFKFSTRNPDAAKQHTIINNFEEYDKHYFLGGSPEFNNFEGMLKNINGLQMHVEGSFKSPKVNNL